MFSVAYCVLCLALLLSPVISIPVPGASVTKVPLLNRVASVSGALGTVTTIGSAFAAAGGKATHKLLDLTFQVGDLTAVFGISDYKLALEATYSKKDSAAVILGATSLSEGTLKVGFLLDNNGADTWAAIRYRVFTPATIHKLSLNFTFTNTFSRWWLQISDQTSTIIPYGLWMDDGGSGFRMCGWMKEDTILSSSDLYGVMYCDFDTDNADKCYGSFLLLRNRVHQRYGYVHIKLVNFTNPKHNGNTQFDPQDDGFTILIVNSFTPSATISDGTTTVGTLTFRSPFPSSPYFGVEWTPYRAATSTQWLSNQDNAKSETFRQELQNEVLLVAYEHQGLKNDIYVNLIRW